MCEYCDDHPKKLIDRALKAIILDMNDGSFIIDIDYDGFEESCNVDFEINYCPMCGRKLSD